MKAQISLFKIFAMINLLLSPLAVAQVGDHSGNGGGEDGVFKGIRDEVDTWMQKNIAINQLGAKLELKSMSGTSLYASFIQAVGDVGEKVVFTREEVKIGDNSRICKNENQTITCNVDAWNATRGDTRFMVVLHEYLGVAGIESNGETDYSRYPISSKILGYVKTKESFELGMEKNMITKNDFLIFMNKFPAPSISQVLQYLSVGGNQVDNCSFIFTLGNYKHRNEATSFRSEQHLAKNWWTVAGSVQTYAPYSYRISYINGASLWQQSSEISSSFTEYKKNDSGRFEIDTAALNNAESRIKEDVKSFLKNGNEDTMEAIKQLLKLVKSGECSKNPYID